MSKTRSALVVEAEFIIALGVQSVLESMDFARVEIARNAAEARAKLAEMSDLSVAVIGLEAGNQDRIHLARTLRDGGHAVLGMTADSALGAGVPELPGTPILLKPVPDEEIIVRINELLAGS